MPGPMDASVDGRRCRLRLTWRTVHDEPMNHSEIVSFLWGVADLIRDSFKRDKDTVTEEHERGSAGRFGPGLPRISDGQTLFLLHMLARAKAPDQGGARIAIINRRTLSRAARRPAPSHSRLSARSRVGTSTRVGSVVPDASACVPAPILQSLSYLVNLLSTQGVGDWLGNESMGSTMQNLNTSIIGRIPAAIPGLTEQRRISRFLDRETTKIEALVAKVREAVDRLKELRTALI